jgi:hypothetical protein
MSQMRPSPSMLGHRNRPGTALPAGPGAPEASRMNQGPIDKETNRYEKWLASLDAHGVQFLVLDTRHDCGLLKAMRSRPEWTVDFADGESVLFARVAA